MFTPFHLEKFSSGLKAKLDFTYRRFERQRSEQANTEEQRKLLVSMLDAVYIDTKNNLVVAIKPKPPFKPVFQVVASKEGSDIRILNEPIEGSSLFLVETGESRTPPNPPIQILLKQRKALAVKFLE